MNRYVRSAITAILIFSLCPWGLAEPDVQRLDLDTARVLSDPANYSRPTVVALWSLDCPHCKKHLRQLGELARQDKRLRVITVAVEPLHPDHGKMLDEARINSDAYAYGDQMPDALNYALDPGWHGELPRTLLFNGRGKGVARSGRLTQPVVKELLELKPLPELR